MNRGYALFFALAIVALQAEEKLFNRVNAICIPSSASLEGADTQMNNYGGWGFTVNTGIGMSKRCYMFMDENGDDKNSARKTCLSIRAPQPQGSAVSYSAHTKVKTARGILMSQPQICHIYYNDNKEVASFFRQLLEATSDKELRKKRVIDLQLGNIPALPTVPTLQEAFEWLRTEGFIE